jgi:hypothetical protein
VQPAYLLAGLAVLSQVTSSARGAVSIVRLIPDAILSVYHGHSLQDIELSILDATNDDSIAPLDYYALVKDAAEVAPRECNGKSMNRRMIIQVTRSTIYYYYHVYYTFEVLQAQCAVLPM